MRDLVRETGLKRETIHFYLAEGLLPPGRKLGRNSVVYGPEHIERLRQIRELRERAFLPLRAIRSVLDGRTDPSFTPAQAELIRRVRASLPPVGTAEGDAATVAVADLGGGLRRGELRELEAAGLIRIRGRGATARLSAEDAEVARAWLELKRIGIGPERGFAPAQLSMYADALEDLVRREAENFSAGFAGVAGPEAAAAVERALPVIDRLLSVLHRRKVREFFLGF